MPAPEAWVRKCGDASSLRFSAARRYGHLLQAHSRHSNHSHWHAWRSSVPNSSQSTNQHFFDAFRQGMREHGYIDGQNVTLSSDGRRAGASAFLNSLMSFSTSRSMLFWR